MNSYDTLTKRLVTYKALYIMLLPGLIILIVFRYFPMYGILLAFKDYNLREGILGSQWVGMKYFEQMFRTPQFFSVFRNTMIISFSNFIVQFPVPIIFALLLMEVQHLRYKKFVQTVSYLPHFISWVVLGGIFIQIFSLDGIVNGARELMGLEPIIFMADPKYFRKIIVGTYVWKTFGWSSVIYFAALAGIDPSLYEAATIDGANRFQKAKYISLPCISGTIVILLILNVGKILGLGFDQIFNMYNASVYQVADIIDTYVYRKGLEGMNYSYGTAVNLFKSIISMTMIVVTNKLARKITNGEQGLW